MPNQLHRPEVSKEVLEEAVTRTVAALGRRLEKHGRGRFAGPHEGLGVVLEEVQELGEAVRSNICSRYQEELLDVAVAAVFALASSVARAREESMP